LSSPKSYNKKYSSLYFKAKFSSEAYLKGISIWTFQGGIPKVAKLWFDIRSTESAIGFLAFYLIAKTFMLREQVFFFITQGSSGKDVLVFSSSSVPIITARNSEKKKRKKTIKKIAALS